MLRELLDRFAAATLVEKIILANVLVFFVTLFINPLQVDWRLDPFRFLAPATSAINAMGATGALAVGRGSQWWTLVTANYVHLGALHLALNMAVLFSLGRIASLIFGEQRFFILYTVGGVTAMYASVLAKIPVTAGASGALCATVGAVIYADWKAGGRSIAELFRSVGIWILMLGLSGFVIPNVNNWAHFGGLAAGVLLGMLLWRGAPADPIEQKAAAMGATACILTTFAAFLLVVIT